VFRLRDRNDRDAWKFFVDLYGPLIYRRSGRQPWMAGLPRMSPTSWV
jgi:hypothetical protein